MTWEPELVRVKTTWSFAGFSGSEEDTVHTSGALSVFRRFGLVAAVTLVGTGWLLTPASSATALLSAVPAGCTKSTNTVTCTYRSGSNAFTVPKGVRSIHVVAVGGKGAGAFETGLGGGAGAVVTGDLAVTPGSTLYAVVGANGGGATPGGAGGGSGGGSPAFCGLPFPPFCFAGGPGGAGGGASDVRTSAGDLASRLLIAAGGGGIGGFATRLFGGGGGGGGGGAGGGFSGTQGCLQSPDCGEIYGGGGGGGTHGSGGAGGAAGCFFGECGQTGSTGGSGVGGPGGDGALILDTPESAASGGGGGGGGGGLFGGGGGGGGTQGGGGGGGGGSNLVPTGGTHAVDTTGVPLVQISYRPGKHI